MAWYAFRHPATPPLGKFALLIIALYLISPIDLIPDTLPVLGWLDDFALAGFILPALLRWLPGTVQAHAHAMTENFLTKFFNLSRR